MNRTTIPQEAERNNVSVRTIGNWMQSGTIPYFKIGKKMVRFDPDEVDRALARFRIGAVGESPAVVSTPTTRKRRMQRISTE